MRRVELAGLFAALAPRFQPIPVLIDLRHTRIDIAIAYVSVVGRIPSDVRYLTEAPVFSGQRRRWVLQWRGTLVRRLLLATKHHVDPTFGRELDHHIRALVGHPNVVMTVDLNGVCEGPRIQVTTDLPNESTVGTKLEELCCGRGISGASRVTTRESKHVSPGIECNTADFTKIQIVRQMQWRGDGIVGNERH